jgi:flagellar biosynthesis protein FlhA
MEVIKQHSSELIDRQQVKMLIDNLAQQQPTLVEEVVPKMFTYGDIQKVLVRLLRENVPIKDMATIVETLADYGTTTKNPDDLTEYVRQNLSRVITQRFFSDDDVFIVALDSKVEQIILEKTKLLDTGAVTILEPAQLQGIYKSTKEIIDKASTQGRRVVVITAPVTRAKFKKIIEQVAPGLTVLSYAEVEPTKQLQIESIIRLP